jgi:hypothetical protein
MKAYFYTFATCLGVCFHTAPALAQADEFCGALQKIVSDVPSSYAKIRGDLRPEPKDPNQLQRPDMHFVKVALPGLQNCFVHATNTEFACQNIYPTAAERDRQLDAARTTFARCLKKQGERSAVETDDLFFTNSRVIIETFNWDGPFKTKIKLVRISNKDKAREAKEPDYSFQVSIEED